MRTPKHPYGNVALITGASSGIGAAAARLFAEHGYTVWGASRFCSEERTPCGAGEIRTVRMDVTDEASVRRAVEIVLRESGEIGVLLHCAGYGIAGAAEDTPVEAAAAQMDTNYFGVLRVNRAVMPAMREKGAGLVLVMSSVAGRVAIPFQSQYSASKFALEATVEAMRAECAPYGIRAALIETGGYEYGLYRGKENDGAARLGLRAGVPPRRGENGAGRAARQAGRYGGKSGAAAGWQAKPAASPRCGGRLPAARAAD